MAVNLEIIKTEFYTVFSVLVSLRKQALTIGTGRNSSCP
jgi:hypothetical protein